MTPLSVLIADDEENIRVLVDQCMKAAGHKAVCVGSASQAFQEMKKRKFDLVITDILMPDGDGLDLITELKKAQPSARIVAISGGGRYVESNDCLRMARGFGAHAVVLKPFNLEQLQAGITQAFAAKA